MPVDRHRRDAVASNLVQYLRHELAFKEFWDSTNDIINAAPLKSRILKQDGGPGFPILIPSEMTHEPIDDRVLDNYTLDVLHHHFSALSLSKKAPAKEQSYNVLVRTVALLRSDLSETELTYPPPPRQLIPFARTTIVVVAFILLATLVILSIDLDAGLLLLWPFFGAFFLGKWRLFTKPPSPEDPDIYPFQSTEQFKSANLLLISNKIPAFEATSYTLPPKPKKKKSFKFYLLLPIIIPMGFLSTFLLLMGLLVAMTLVLLLWPFTLLSMLRKYKP